MNNKPIGLWLIGALGGVGTTVALGLAAWRRGLMDGTGLVTELPLFDGLDLDGPDGFVVGGHDIRNTTFGQTAEELHRRANLFDGRILDACAGDLETWTSNVRPGTLVNSGAAIARLADHPGIHLEETPQAAIGRIEADLRAFQAQHQLERLIVVHVASTEAPFPSTAEHQSVRAFVTALEQRKALVPASSLYAWAALDLGLPFINFTPSLGASFPAAIELAQTRKTVTCGRDGKTGETLMKSVLAPMFARRNLNILSWVGHNIFGNRDGLVLDDPANKASKVRTKDQLIQQIVGYKPQTHVSIEYIESLDDWKTAWDHIHFQGFLGTKMFLQFTWQGCDSILAAPLVLDLVRLTLLAQRRGETGVLRHLACFFKNPMDVDEHDFFKQFAMLENYVLAAKNSATV